MKRLLYNNPVLADYVFFHLGIPSRSDVVSFGTFDTEKGILGGVVYDRATDTNIFGHFASTDPRWLTPSLLWAAFDYPFNQLGLERITGTTPAKNRKAREMNKKMGFRFECMLKRAAQGGDDVIVSVMWKDDCKYLDNPRYQLQERHVDFELIGVPHG
jgi:hypothetical protein